MHCRSQPCSNKPVVPSRDYIQPDDTNLHTQHKPTAAHVPNHINQRGKKVQRIDQFVAGRNPT